MNIGSIQLALLLGPLVPTPAPLEVMNALQSVDVTQAETTGFQMVFRVERDIYSGTSYPLLDNALLRPGSRVIVTITINALSRVLLDGIITHHQLAPDDASGTLLLTVTGEDLSVLMDLYELAVQYPGLGDYEIANLVLLKYAPLGVVPTVIPPLSSPVSLPIDYIPQQSSSDKQYLQSLAAEHGYIFFVKPGLFAGQNFAYWGPPSRVGLPQKALTINSGMATNVEAINFSYDALAPQEVYGEVSDEDTELVLPLATFVGTLMPPLASTPPLPFNEPFVRKNLFSYQGSSYIDALARAQSITNQSLEHVVTADGTLDVLRYGDILTAPGLVGVRGAGFAYDGYYYIKSVSHQISRGQYKESFSLAREGTGSLTTGVIA